MISLAQKLARLADIFGGGSAGYGTPLANRNYITDPNFDQILTNTVALTSGLTTVALAAMYRLSAGAGGTATTYAATPGLAANDQPGMYSPMGGSVSITPNGDSTGTIGARTLPCILQDVEFVQTLNGRSATFSCWLWTGGGTVTVSNLVAAQAFGTGGSPSATVVIDTPVNWVITATAQRFSARVDFPSVQGKTLGTNKNDYVQIGFFLPANNTVNVGTRQWQLEQSSPQAPAAGLPTAFEYRGYQAEEARTSRYFEVLTAERYGVGGLNNTTTAYIMVPYRRKRAAPNVIYTAAATYSLLDCGYGYLAPSAVVGATSSIDNAIVTVTVAGATLGQPAILMDQSGSSITIDARI